MSDMLKKFPALTSVRVWKIGEELWVHGLINVAGAARLAELPKKADRAIEPGCRVYADVVILTEENIDRYRGGYMTNDLRGRMAVGQIYLRLVRWADGMPLKSDVGITSVELTFDPWSHVSAGSGCAGPDGIVDGVPR